MSRIKSTLLFIGFATACCLSPAIGDDTKYESSNQAQSVRSPVLDELPDYSGPERIEYSKLSKQQLLAARNLDQIAKMVGKDATVIGKVESVFIPRGENKVILNFGRDIRNCFKAVIDRRDFFKWATDDPAVIAKMYENQNVAVDGLVVLFQEKPQIAVTLPGQLKLVTGSR
jgi:hypothetical protein